LANKYTQRDRARVSFIHLMALPSGESRALFGLNMNIPIVKAIFPHARIIVGVIWESDERIKVALATGACAYVVNGFIFRNLAGFSLIGTAVDNLRRQSRQLAS
jgi:hypothetical protein